MKCEFVFGEPLATIPEGGNGTLQVADGLRLRLDEPMREYLRTGHRDVPSNFYEARGVESFSGNRAAVLVDLDRRRLRERLRAEGIKVTSDVVGRPIGVRVPCAFLGGGGDDWSVLITSFDPDERFCASLSRTASAPLLLVGWSQVLRTGGVDLFFGGERVGGALYEDDAWVERDLPWLTPAPSDSPESDLDFAVACVGAWLPRFEIRDLVGEVSAVPFTTVVRNPVQAQGCHVSWNIDYLQY
jgi:hypothetical protein